MVIKILEMALPVLIMLGLGYFCKAKNVFDEKGLLGLKAFISNITLPVVLFNAFLCTATDLLLPPTGWQTLFFFFEQTYEMAGRLET